MGAFEILDNISGYHEYEYPVIRHKLSLTNLSLDL